MTSETQLIDYNRRVLVKSVGLLVPNLHEGNFIFLKVKTPNGLCSYFGIVEEVIKPNKQQ